MRKMTKLALLLKFLLVANLTVNAQVTFNTDWIQVLDTHHHDYEAALYDGVNGNPFLLKDWSKGSVTSGTAVLKDQLLKFDEIENRLLIKGDDGVARTFKTVINSFTIADKNKERVFASGFHKGLENDNFTFFEVLAGEKVKFLKRNVKVISVSTEYSGKVVKNVTSEIKYFISLPGKAPEVIKLGDKTLLTILGNKGSELDSYIKANKLNLKREDDVVKLINHYNTL
ncbi:hypothetical protein [Pedobacter chitinilyticus]|uniref:Uncharacterized protein n=1 Tax=Pedobacter chitinilyticus TaxID=2233776 RepID=A0A3S3PBW5_9SPHI|nr:hypothetical protein [Pedobacter chitinilyticus]RWU07735.1 hypothetical protein DPV69_12200 [Pedobacter chitinilyticus]